MKLKHDRKEVTKMESELKKSESQFKKDQEKLNGFEDSVKKAQGQLVRLEGSVHIYCSEYTLSILTRRIRSTTRPVSPKNLKKDIGSLNLRRMLLTER